MNCNKYMALSEPEQKEYLGRLIHAAISSDIGFEAGKEVIEYGEEVGAFEGVKIGHDNVYDKNNEL